MREGLCAGCLLSGELNTKARLALFKDVCAALNPVDRALPRAMEKITAEPLMRREHFFQLAGNHCLQFLIQEENVAHVRWPLSVSTKLEDGMASTLFESSRY